MIENYTRMRSLKTTFITLLLIVPILTSCNKESFGNTPEEKIIGTWTFDKVKYKPDGDISYTDFSSGYNNCTITFQSDGVLIAYDAKTNDTAEGYWYIDWYIEYDDNDDTEKTIYVMIGNVSNTDMAINEDLYWDNLSVRNSKVEGDEVKDNGKYKYTLARI